MQSALKVTAPGDKVRLFNARPGETSTTFELMATAVRRRVAARFAGGCKGMTDEDKEEMIRFFLAAYGGYKGLLFSGGTRMLRGEKLDPMVTDVPVFISQALGNEGSIALGTVPQTDIPFLKGESQLVFDDSGTRPNPGMSGILVVQKSADDFMEWDGDLAVYFGMLERLQKFAMFTGVHLVAWNGGAVTRTEIMMAARRGWPVFLINGSGRVAEELAQAVLDGNFEPFKAADVPDEHFDRIIVVGKDDPKRLHDELIWRGIIHQSDAAEYDRLHSAG